MAERPFAFHDLPAGAFPFKIEFLNALGIVVHTITVPGPGSVEIPGLAEEHGRVTCRVTLANGEVITE